MTNELAIRILTGDVLGTSEQTQEAVTMAVKALAVKALSQSYVPDTNVGDTISRRAAIDELIKMLLDCFQADEELVDAVATTIKDLQSVEPLTDKEQRIFLAAMGREEMICEEVDRNYVREPYEDSLVRVCKGIIRKVKGALWTQSADGRQ